MRDSQLADAILTPDQLLDEPAPDWFPLMSVPQLLGVTPGRTLVQEPYLRSDPERRASWQKCLGSGEGLLVGINWQGSPNKIGDSHLNQRSLPLEALAPIAALAGVRLVSLQKGHGMEQRSVCSFADRFVAAQEEIDDRLDFREVAAVLDCCDVVISCDTVIPHLAAALGRPTWTLLCAQPEWRWGQEGASTPWYPTMQLFRQDRLGCWEEPVQRLGDQLRSWLATGDAPPPPTAS
jgi:ADP-heptose:LPS heptosyltransferase